MRTATWAALNRMEHPPIMTEQLVTALKTTRAWRDAMSLSEHVARRAVAERVVEASRDERRVLGMEVPKGRERRSQMAGRDRQQQQQQIENQQNGLMSSSSQLLKNAEQQQRQEKMRWQSEVVAGVAHGHASSPATIGSGTSLVPVGASALSSSGGGGGNGASLLVGGESSTAAPKIARIDVLDCTFGGGHHSRALLEGGDPFTRVVALDCDLDVVADADALAREFGPKRFRFFANHMSNALTMFGEEKFDFMIIDPGPNAAQLFDPSRGFVIDAEANHRLDMRYSAKVGTSALQWLIAEDIIQAATSLSSVGLLPFRTAHLMMTIIKDSRPLTGSSDVFGLLGSGRFGELPEDTWVTQKSERELSPAMRFVMSLRAVVNNEVFELSRTVSDAMLLLRRHGHLAVVTRHPWERRVVEAALKDHPYGLLAYSQRIEDADVAEFGVPRSTEMHLYRRLAKPAAVVRNSVLNVSEEERVRSSFSRMAGLHTTSVGKAAFPSKNFTFNGVADEVEASTIERNARGPLVDEGWLGGEAAHAGDQRQELEDHRTRKPSKRMPHH